MPDVLGPAPQESQPSSSSVSSFLFFFPSLGVLPFPIFGDTDDDGKEEEDEEEGEDEGGSGDDDDDVIDDVTVEVSGRSCGAGFPSASAERMRR